MKRTMRREDILGKENINSNIPEEDYQNMRQSSREGRRKRTAHFANINPDYDEDQLSPRAEEESPQYHKKTYSYLNSNADNESVDKELYASGPLEDESEFEFTL